MQIQDDVAPELIQGTPEWLALRKTKITATDASIIMGVSPWKTCAELYWEKISENRENIVTKAMQRGIDLEPIARELFIIKHGVEVHPKVVIKDWAMASLDGMDFSGEIIVEIKCAGPKDHATALSGKIPDHYYPQLQHQLYVTGVQLIYYFSFDGFDGVTIPILRNEEYIKEMIGEEWKFYQYLINRMPP